VSAVARACVAVTDGGAGMGVICGIGAATRAQSVCRRRYGRQRSVDPSHDGHSCSKQVRSASSPSIGRLTCTQRSGPILSFSTQPRRRS
jgi:hypothetical protein